MTQSLDTQPHHSPGGLHASGAAVSLLALLFAVAISLGGMLIVFGDRSTDFEELGVGLDAKKVYLPGILCRDPRDAHRCFEASAERAAPRRVLLVGNSQLYVINSWRGEAAAPVIMHKALMDRGIDVISLSLPGLTHQEQLVLVEFALAAMPFDLVILSVVYPLMGDRGLRNSVLAELGRDSMRQALAGSEVGRNLVALYDSTSRKGYLPPPKDPGVDEPVATTLQDLTEIRIEKWLNDNSRLWRLRLEMRGQIALYAREIRNALLRADAATLRNNLVDREKTADRRIGIKDARQDGGTHERALVIDPGGYAINLHHIDGLLSGLSRRGIRALVYIAPFPSMGYARVRKFSFLEFRNTIEDIVQRNGAHFLDLEPIVPDRAWTSRVVEGITIFDLMHFNGEGHRVLAERLISAVDGVFADAAK